MKSIKNLLFSLKRRIYKNPKPSLSDLDNKLEKYLNFKDGFFIEAGANDGYSQSNTYYLEKKKGWKGLLVEAIPELYNKCKKERPYAHVFNYALTSEEFSNTHITMNYVNLMSVVAGSMKSSDEEQKHINDGLKIQNIDKAYQISVPATTLESLLNTLPKVPVIDFLSLDVEGYEKTVLQGLNLKKYRPRYILVEARYFDEVDNYLIQNNYKEIDKLSSHDYLYIDCRK